MGRKKNQDWPDENPALQKSEKEKIWEKEEQKGFNAIKRLAAEEAAVRHCHSAHLSFAVFHMRHHHHYHKQHHDYAGWGAGEARKEANR